MRKTNFANDEYYHVYNRGTDKRKIFLDYKDYDRFIKSLDEFNSETPAWKFEFEVGPRIRLVEIIAYCLNPNHYHLILKQLKENGITEFMRKIGTGYTMYFNKKNERNGVLFQGKFKAIHIDSNEYLLYLSAYVNQNNFIHGYTKKNSWKYSSLDYYFGKKQNDICNPSSILGQFRNENDYREFVCDNAQHLKEKKQLEKYLLE